ncbi:MAG TPA: glycine cleavage system aminomethyltransferase GcvT [Candidatus Thermoplasmatota archaeon]|nr:glycine cleavage system aminomethyltransferase GcvT [Candidatus Thermoplasmatota archaeon]
MTLLRTPLHDLHRTLGARLVPFAGYEMPVMYTSIVDEHMAVRRAVGLFDVSHMSNLWFRGDPARLARAVVADAASIKVGGSKYTMALRDDGTILDDLYLFRYPEGFHVVPNAGMNEALREHVERHSGQPVQDVTRETFILALQGPKAAAALAPLSEFPVADLKPFRCTRARVAGVDLLLTRTGYTGEDGFELMGPAAAAERLFEALLAAGREHGILPCGLGARDTLRLEKGFCLAGHEFEGGRTPLEAKLSKFVHWEHEFAGRKALEAQRQRDDYERLVGLVAEQGIPRQGSEIREPGGRRVGVVTSGTLSPILKKGIALGYVAPSHRNVDARLEIVTRGQAAQAKVVPLPFV